MDRLLKPFVVFVLLSAPPLLGGTSDFVSGVVPHYHEFDVSENPQGYYWCGHTALKAVGEYITGETKILQDIHNTFYLNSAGYRADNYCYTNDQWCASLQDLKWAASLSQNGGYGRSETVVRVIDRGASNAVTTFFNKVKDGITLDYPPIIASKWYYNNAGHFWVVTGYYDSGHPSTSYLYLRDVARTSPRTSRYDRYVKVSDFFNATNHTGNTIHILFVK